MPSLKTYSFYRPHFVLFLLAVFSFILPQTSFAEKRKAADRVQDKAPINLEQKKFSLLFAELEQKHKFKPEELRQIFQGQVIKKRVLELMDSQWEAKPYYKYRPLFITRKTIRTGKKKLQQYKNLLDRIEQKFGVDREILVAIWAIETRFGTNFGGFNVLQTLTTLFDAYPRRSAFFRQQLIDFLILCRENQVNPHTVEGSYAGAFGQTQFIPSSFLDYAVSFDGDTQRDVWKSVPDVLASIANYLKQFHWTLHAPVYIELGTNLHDKQLIAAWKQGRKGRVEWRSIRKYLGKAIPPSPDNRPLSVIGLEVAPAKNKARYRFVAGYPNFQAITEWNHSNRYAMAVTELAESFIKP
jgi:membrane-bound lytic murein transglycosylase B